MNGRGFFYVAGVLLVFMSGLALANKKLEKVSDNDMLNLIQTEKHVVVLFSKELSIICVDERNSMYTSFGGLME
jgi:hypothetical protein